MRFGRKQEEAPAVAEEPKPERKREEWLTLVQAAQYTGQPVEYLEELVRVGGISVNSVGDGRPGDDWMRFAKSKLDKHLDPEREGFRDWRIFGDWTISQNAVEVVGEYRKPGDAISARLSGATKEILARRIAAWQRNKEQQVS